MKKIKNPFSYSVGHGFAGQSCSHHCRFFNYNKNTKIRACALHKLNLNNVFLTEDGYVRGEFFCCNYENLIDENNYGAHKVGLEEFKQIKNELEENILYEACQKEYLCMTPFEEIEKVSD